MSSPHAQALAPWAGPADVDRVGCKGDDVVDPGALATGLWMASDVLCGFTGWIWPGVGVDTLRPCGRRCGVCGARPTSTCHCGGTLSSVLLPGRPVVGVDEVTLDGEVLDPALYRVDDRRALVLVAPDGAGPLGRRSWPCCQDMSLEPTEERTWQVVYRWGAVPPPGGVTSAAILGWQFALKIDPTTCDSDACALPDGTEVVTRDGLTVRVDRDLWSKGRTGLDVVDAWLASLEAGRAVRPARLFRPGGRRSGRRTGTGTAATS